MSKTIQAKGKGSARVLLVVLGLGMWVWGENTVVAIPPPQSEADLNKHSDVVATIRVLGVARTQDIPLGQQKIMVPAYQAWLQVIDVKKGSVKKGDTLLVRWRDTPPRLIGGWKVAYGPGEEVLTHLKWSADHRCYESTWWNAKGRPVKPQPLKLPEKTGQVIFAPLPR